MKLTKTQQDLMDWAKRQIDYARTHDFIHWLSNAHGYDLDLDWDAHPNPYLSNEQVWKDAQMMVEKDKKPVIIEGHEIFPAGWWMSKYEAEKEGIITTQASSNTLRALQRMGLIEIIHDAGIWIDTIRVLNY